MSCPAPFCPPGGAAYCQPETATPVDCGLAHFSGPDLPSGGKRPGGEFRQGQRRAAGRSASHQAFSSRDGDDAFRAWKDNDDPKVNGFTRCGKSQTDSARVPAAPHPLTQAAGQWQRQARQIRQARAENLPVSAVRDAASGSALPVSEETPPLPRPLSGDPKGHHSGWREERPGDGGRSGFASFRQAAQDELRAWRRPSRRQACSVPPAQEEPALSDRRLNKVIAEAGYCSRRKADELIFAGRVSVNGGVETHAGRRIGPEDSVSVDGKPISRTQQMLCLMLNKPVQVVSTAADPQGRQTVLSLVARDHPGIRLFPVGRLDYFSEGLILLTNDGRLAQRLMHPRHHLPKHYEVLVRDVVTQKALQTMRSGMCLAEGEVLLPVEVTARSTASGCTLLRMILRQGVNRQIRRMCRDLGLTILRLRRVAIGPLQLGKLAPGQCRPLEESELAALRRAVGIR